MPGKTEIVTAVTDKTGMKKADVQRVLDEALSEMRTSLEQGESISLRGFGSFKVTKREARKGRNPRTGAEIDIAEGQRVSFKMSK